MDFAKVDTFLRTHWPAFLMAAVICGPAVWGVASLHYSMRIEVLEIKVKDLSEKVSVLDQLEKRRRERYIASTAEFSAQELFTPSRRVRREVAP